MNEEKTKAVITEILDSVSTLGLATVDEDGNPHACNLYFVADEAFNIYFLSLTKSRHSQHTSANPNAAASIYVDVPSPRDIHGVQIHGTCSIIEGEEREAALEMYFEKFDFARAMGDRIANEALYKLSPKNVRLIDNREQFGTKIDIAF